MHTTFVTSNDGSGSIAYIYIVDTPSFLDLDGKVVLDYRGLPTLNHEEQGW